MKVHTFVGKVGMESLRQMDDQVNSWIERHQIEPKEINQTFGYLSHHDVSSQEPVVITSIWY